MVLNWPDPEWGPQLVQVDKAALLCTRDYQHRHKVIQNQTQRTGEADLDIGPARIAVDPVPVFSNQVIASIHFH